MTMKKYIFALMLLNSSIFSTQNSINEKIPDFYTRLKGTCYYTYLWKQESNNLSRVMWNIYKLPNKKICILGGGQIEKDSYYYNKAKKLCSMCLEHNIGIINGGGSGIMQAAAEASTSDSKQNNYKLGIIVDKFEDINKYEKILKIGSIEARSWSLLNFVDAAIFFPGGLGTLYEFFYYSMMKGVSFLNEDIVIILYGSDYWNPVISLLKNISDNYHTINKNIFDSFYKIVDSEEEALNLILKASKDVDVLPFNIKKK